MVKEVINALKYVILQYIVIFGLCWLCDERYLN